MIHATWMNGRAIPEQQVDWPDGSVVYLSRTPLPEGDTLEIADQNDDLVAVTSWLKWYDALDPLVYAPGEEAEIDAARQNIADESQPVRIGLLESNEPREAI